MVFHSVPTLIMSKDKAFSATEVTRLRVQLLAIWLIFKLQKCRANPKNKNRRRRILIPSHLKLFFTNNKLPPDLFFNPWLLARCQNFDYSYVYKKKVSNSWLEQMFVVTVHSLLLLPVKLKVNLSFHHKNNETSTPQQVKAVLDSSTFCRNRLKTGETRIKSEPYFLCNNICI